MRSLWLAATALIVVAVACSSSDPPPPAFTQVDAAAPPPAPPPAPPADAAPPSADAAPDAPPPKPVRVTLTNETVQVGGRARTFLLGIPKRYDAQKTYPIVLSFHGDGGDGRAQRGGDPFDDYSGDDAIVVYPDGIDRGWDLYGAPIAQNREVLFVDAILAFLSGRYSVDAARVFATGYSSGGFIVSQLACRRPGLFRAITIHAGGAPYENDLANPPLYPNGAHACVQGASAPPNAQAAVPVMVFHGTNDFGVEVASGDYAATYWAYVNGCQSTRSAATPSPCVKHDGCPADKPALWCLVPNLGHVVWSEGNRLSWEFFRGL